MPLANLPVEGTLSRYVHDTALADLSVRQVSRIIQRASDTPLGIPLPQGIDLKRLFATFSPVWEIDVVSEDDHLGTPYWPVEAITPAVDPAQPVTYTLLSHIRLGNETLLQLNYVMWFRARPRTGVLDLLGGPVDGITWRVTLRADGEVAFYGTMHNCGCYHMVFPTSNVRVVKRQSGHEEPLLIAPRNIAAGGHPVVRVQSATHYIQQVYFEEVELARGITYPLRAYDELRSLPFSTRRRRSFLIPTD